MPLQPVPTSSGPSVQQPPGRGRRWAVSLIAGALVVTTTACGARWTDEQRASVEARGTAQTAATSTGSAQTPTRSTGSAFTPTSVGPATGETSTTVAAPDGAPVTADNSGIDTVGGPADQPGSLPCAAPSDAPGVTDGEIAIGTISSLSGPVPGLGVSAAAAARAHVAHRNATGGVCGRQITLREADDGTDNGRYRAVVGDLGPQVFGLAGGFALGDVGGTDVVQQQSLPVVNLPSADSVGALPTVFDINPPFPDPAAGTGKYRYLRGEGARTAAVVYLAVDQSRAEANLQRQLMEAEGIEIVLVRELQVATLSYDSAARAVANSRADYLFFIGDVNGSAAMARAVADSGYDLRFAEYYTFAYGTAFTELAGSAAEGTMAWLRSLPNEEAASNAELSTFLEWMERVAPDAAVDPFAVDSWVSAKAFFDALESLPGPITRDSFVARLRATETFDADGMFGPIELGPGITRGCLVGLRYESGTWRRLAPDSGFLC